LTQKRFERLPIKFQMKYFSTKKQSAHVSFRDAVLKGQPEDEGLYFPESIPKFSFEDFRNKSKEQIAFEVIKPYVGGETYFRS
jgi:threonine synthase